MEKNTPDTVSYSALSKHSTKSTKSPRSTLAEVFDVLRQARLAVYFQDGKNPVRCQIQLISDMQDMKQRKISFQLVMCEQKASYCLENVRLSYVDWSLLPYSQRVSKYIDDGAKEAARYGANVQKPDKFKHSKIDGYFLTKCLYFKADSGSYELFLAPQIERRMVWYIKMVSASRQQVSALYEKNTLLFRDLDKMYYKFKILSINDDSLVRIRLTNADGERIVIDVNLIRHADMQYDDTRQWLYLIQKENLGFDAPLDFHHYEEDSWITLFFQSKDSDEILDWYNGQNLEQDNDGFIRSEGL